MSAPLSPWTALIPLRGGSKGLPGKNLRPLAGKPLYMHAVDLALAAGAQRVVITTDIPDVLEATLPDKACVLRRPAELCLDTTPMAPVVLHALEHAYVSGTVVLLQATSPLRQVCDVQSALELLGSGRFDLVMSVTEAERSVLKWGFLENDQYVALSRPEYCFANRQSLPAVYKPNGAVYAFNASWFADNQGFVTNRIGVVVMPLGRSLDVDTIEDFVRCEALIQQESHHLSV